MSNTATQQRLQIRNKIACNAPLAALEAQHQTDALAWVDSGLELIRKIKPATPPKHLVSYFAVVDLDARHILLVDLLCPQLRSRRAGSAVGRFTRSTPAA